MGKQKNVLSREQIDKALNVVHFLFGEGFILPKRFIV